MTNWTVRYAKKLFLKSLENLEHGFLELVCPEATHCFGDPKAELRAMAVIHDERFFLRALTGADVGMGESYMDGDWSSPDLVSVVRVATRNLRNLDSGNALFSGLRKAAFRWQHRHRDNSEKGSRENIRAHYDLGNEFYRLFLDEQMLYSAAYFQNDEETLEQAQKNKMELICRKLKIEPGDRVLEIGCGWGGFAVHASRNYGAHVTGVTISRAQYDMAMERMENAGVAPGSVQILLEDYRRLRGRFDQIVSIEMFEAVGLAHYDEFFGRCDHLLAPDGTMLLQTITMPDQELKGYRRRVDWIQTYIFPGSELAFLGKIQESLAKVTRMSLTDFESLGTHYARTLSLWRERFFQQLAEMQGMGFDERFQRMWDFYMSWSEGAFRERYINVVHLLMAKNGTSKRVIGDPILSGGVLASERGLP
jgi:cyclopropane-fatty-acyl-phospholipid synthase